VSGNSESHPTNKHRAARAGCRLGHTARSYECPACSEANGSGPAAESYFSQLKRSIDGTYHHVSKTHLQRYLDEFDFRYSTCKMADSQRLQRMVDQSAGRRLAYKPLKDRSEG
jgi:hypothetical protein